MAYVTFERLLRYKDKSKLHRKRTASMLLQWHQCNDNDKLRKGR